MFRAAPLCTLVGAAMLACAPAERALEWEYVVRDADRAALAVAYEARVLDEGCDDATVRWRARWRSDESASAPPILPPGSYGLVVIALDETCRPVAAACRAIDLPRAPDQVVRLELLPADGSACGMCDAGVCPEDDDPLPFATCDATREAGASCSDGRDDDCDRTTDCGDADCQGTSACACEEGGCGECERCVDGRCIAVSDEAACTTAAGPGRCVRGACCNGCALDDACAPGTSPGLCGVPGGECVACGCPSLDGCEAGACIERGNAIEIAAGPDYTCALESSGRAQCWGDGRAGRLGTDATTIEETPAIVRCTNGSTSCEDWRDLSLGTSHACAIRASSGRDRVACWGGNEHLQLGRGVVSGTPIPGLAGGPFGVMDSMLWAVDVAAGDAFTCAIGRDMAVTPTEGRLFCWGSIAEGRLGVMATSDRGSPTIVPVMGDPDLMAVAVGRAHGCVLASDGALFCWGSNDHGQVGTGSTDATVAVPTRITGTFAAVAAGGDHTCARRLTGTPVRERVECWGRNDAGQLGLGDRGDRNRPVPLAEFPNGAYPMALGSAHTCVLDTMGRLSCFGDDSRGQIGAAAGADTSLPMPVLVGRTWKSVAAGGDHTCVVGMGGEIVCWGDNTTGECGRAPMSAAVEPGRVCL
ncbi:RCC1 domain-containing protein [Sandaracinus amylolyticus]|uniref:BNR repeat domain protein n=1 Tax=Sandaracinus amylolyticus TaxID=927083 RepID=A0A0F6SHT2_9BACT|nr:RCC1 domain-containing protein [Sandaracinus amylolyticus]AKF10989.1 BNR repeat domain protein [Sandaracinus amylolyticus]